jgi:predicted dehydrogenase
MTTHEARSGPVKVAIAGAGMISWHHLIAWRNAGARVRVVAVCDPDGAKAERRAQEFGIPRVYSDANALFAGDELDALDVASPRETHAAWVDAAAARGIDVLCQKPLTPTFAESEALVRRTAGKIRLMAHENWRFRPWYRELRRWIDQRDLGDVLLGSMSLMSSGMLPDATGKRPSFERQPFMQHEPRLMLAEVLIHHLDVMRYLCGPLTVLSARTARTLADVEGETLAAVSLETADGAPIEVIGTMAAAAIPRGRRTGWKSSGPRRARSSTTGRSSCAVRSHAA